MNFTRYYAALLFQQGKRTPTFDEAHQDFQRMLEWRNSTIWYGA